MSQIYSTAPPAPQQWAPPAHPMQSSLGYPAAYAPPQPLPQPQPVYQPQAAAAQPAWLVQPPVSAAAGWPAAVAPQQWQQAPTPTPGWPAPPVQNVQPAVATSGVVYPQQQPQAHYPQQAPQQQQPPQQFLHQVPLQYQQPPVYQQQQYTQQQYQPPLTVSIPYSQTPAMPPTSAAAAAATAGPYSQTPAMPPTSAAAAAATAGPYSQTPTMLPTSAAAAAATACGPGMCATCHVRPVWVDHTGQASTTCSRYCRDAGGQAAAAVADGQAAAAAAGGPGMCANCHVRPVWVDSTGQASTTCGRYCRDAQKKASPLAADGSSPVAAGGATSPDGKCKWCGKAVGGGYFCPVGCADAWELKELLENPTQAGTGPVQSFQPKLRGLAHIPDRERDKVALHYACAAKDMWLVTELLNVGTPADIETKKGLTPLHYACIGGDINIIKLLISRGAKENHMDKSGMYPRDRAQSAAVRSALRRPPFPGLTTKDVRAKLLYPKNGMKNAHSYVQVASDTPEFWEIERLMNTTIFNGHNSFQNSPYEYFNVHSITRYWNSTRWAKFQSLKAQQHMYLFHGTELQTQYLIEDGAIRSSPKGTFGPAIYMAQNSSLAHLFAKTKDNKDRYHYMFLLIYAAGNIIHSNRHPRHGNDDTQIHAERTSEEDTIIQRNPMGFNEFLSWNPDRVYPVYRIRYQPIDVSGNVIWNPDKRS